MVATLLKEYCDCNNKTSPNWSVAMSGCPIACPRQWQMSHDCLLHVCFLAPVFSAVSLPAGRTMCCICELSRIGEHFVSLSATLAATISFYSLCHLPFVTKILTPYKF